MRQQINRNFYNAWYIILEADKKEELQVTTYVNLNLYKNLKQ